MCITFFVENRETLRKCKLELSRLDISFICLELGEAVC